MFLIHQVKLQVFALLVCILFFGCQQIAKPEIYGVYEANFDEGIERIILLPDDIYKQEIHLKSGASYVNEGSYSFSKIDGIITFKQALSIDLTDWNKTGFTADKLDELVHIKAFGGITLNFNEDLGIYYKKIRQ